MTEQALAISNNSIIHDMDDAARAAKTMAASGFFEDAKDVAKAAVKIMAGHEMGFGPFASMTGIHIIKGKPAIGANLIAAAIKKHPDYNYKVLRLDNDACEIEFFERWNGKYESIGISAFKVEDAKAAGLTGNPTWSKFARNMLFARAISNGARWYTPGIYGGAPMYTPEELGADIDMDGNVIDVVEAPKPQPEPAQDAEFVEEPKADTGLRLRLTPDKLKAAIIKKAASYEGRTCTKPQRGLMDGMLQECFAGDESKRKEFSSWLTGHASSDDIPAEYVIAILDWLKATKDSGGAYQPDDMAVREANSALTVALIDAGQMSFD